MLPAGVSCKGGGYHPRRRLVPAHQEEGPEQEPGGGGGVRLERPLRPLQAHPAEQPALPSKGGRVLDIYLFSCHYSDYDSVVHFWVCSKEALPVFRPIIRLAYTSGFVQGGLVGGIEGERTPRLYTNGGYGVEASINQCARARDGVLKPAQHRQQRFKSLTALRAPFYFPASGVDFCSRANSDKPHDLCNSFRITRMSPPTA